MTQSLTHVIIGGGAAGFFGAISCAEHFPGHQVILLEKTRQLLSKVRISGGGRCNVTHACFDPKQLVKNYPRGSKELLGPFHRFQPQDTVQWFERRGVKLKTEEDGRMFPVTDSSETIITCLQNAARQAGVEIRIEQGVEKIDKTDTGFCLHLSNGSSLNSDRLLIATGSASKIYGLVEQLGHSCVPLVPSLFTFNTPQSPFLALAGISVLRAKVSLPELNQSHTGPLLITHWGFSGPAVLKLSAWAARELHAKDYQAKLVINWLPELQEGEVRQHLQENKRLLSAKQTGTESLFDLPKQLWRKLISLAEIDPEQRWSTVTNKQVNFLIHGLLNTTCQIQGKTTYKVEFVTCGGVSLDEVNFKTMESKLCPRLFFAGEVLNIDGITGGFNFQNAWTTGWIAGQSMG